MMSVHWLCLGPQEGGLHGGERKSLSLARGPQSPGPEGGCSPTWPWEEGPRAPLQVWRTLGKVAPKSPNHRGIIRWENVVGTIIPVH